MSGVTNFNWYHYLKTMNVSPLTLLDKEVKTNVRDYIYTFWM